jgi:cyclophilin family peptidyl-prolyl cis-trans isomerase
MQAALTPMLMMMFSVLFPSKMWYAPDQPIHVQIKGSGGDVVLVLTDFLGKRIEGETMPTFHDNDTVDIKTLWPTFRNPGTYLLLAVPKGKSPSQFVGTPLVITVREDRRRDAAPGPMVIKVEPLRFAIISTDKGKMTAVFYYDAAPDTVNNFLTLASEGFYDGLPIHRIVKNFVVQMGDPRGDGTGGPGYHIEAEFNPKAHVKGVLSMARQGDPLEAQGQMPRTEAANSAGSQFFICLNEEYTKQLNGRYTAFGRVVEGLDVLDAIAATPTDAKTERPTTREAVDGIRVISVTPENNPYASILNLSTVPVETPSTPPAGAAPAAATSRPAQ